MSFQSEMKEIMTDISVEMAGYMENQSPETVRILQDYLDKILTACKNNPELFLASLRTLVFMMFLAGREHALRGYKSPFPATTGFTSVTHTEFEEWLASLPKEPKEEPNA